MNKTLALWMAIGALLALRSFVRPSYAVGLYMLTFFAAPRFWWWGDIVELYRWNFYSGLLLLGALVVTDSGDSIKRERPFATDVVPILLLMVVNAVAVHYLLAVNADASSGWLLNRLKFVLLFFLLQYAVRDEKDFRIVAMSMALGAGYLGYEATFNDRGSFSGGRLEGIGAAGVTSSNHLASLLITTIPLGATYIFTRAKLWLKGTAVVASGLAFNVVLLCNSRGAFLGLLLSGVVVLIMASGPARQRSLKFIGAAAVGALMLLGDPEIVNRFMTTFTGETQRDASAQSRLIFWSAAREMIIDHPFGSGGNSFSEGRGWEYLSVGDAPGNTRAVHNGFITETADWGVQGITLMLLFLGAVWRTAWRGRRLAISAGDGDGVMVHACIAAALSAWLVSCIFGDYLNDEWGFWVGAMAYAYLRLQRTREGAKSVAPPVAASQRSAPLTPALSR